MQFDQLKRREFVTLLGGAAAWPLAARAQQPSLPVIAFLSNESFNERQHQIAAFRNGLNDAGYVEGRNVAFEFRSAEHYLDPLAPMIADLISNRRVAMIVASGSPAVALAAKAATATIPILFATGGDPVKLGLVASFNRPGGNVTGVNLFNADLVAKQIELLHELVPQAAAISVLSNPDKSPSHRGNAIRQGIYHPRAVVSFASQRRRIGATRKIAPQRPDCVPGHVRLELGNVEFSGGKL